MKNCKKLYASLFLLFGIFSYKMLAFAENIAGEDDSGVSGVISLDYGNSNVMKIVLILTILSLAPSILILMTAFARIVIVLSFTRSALGTQQMPPNQILIGLALFLTFFIMQPTFIEVKENAYDPFMAGTITQDEAFEEAMTPIREFMFAQTEDDPTTLNMFIELSTMEEAPGSLEDIPSEVLIPAFITSELKKAFKIGFLLYIPFIMIDMIVSSTLMAMGMMMLPPAMISLPFKVLLFVMIDGWDLVMKTIIKSFA